MMYLAVGSMSSPLQRAQTLPWRGIRSVYDLKIRSSSSPAILT